MWYSSLCLTLTMCNMYIWIQKKMEKNWNLDRNGFPSETRYDAKNWRLSDRLPVLLYLGAWSLISTPTWGRPRVADRGLGTRAWQRLATRGPGRPWQTQVLQDKKFFFSCPSQFQARDFPPLRDFWVVLSTQTFAIYVHRRTVDFELHRCECNESHCVCSRCTRVISELSVVQNRGWSILRIYFVYYR